MTCFVKGKSKSFGLRTSTFAFCLLPFHSPSIVFIGNSVAAFAAGSAMHVNNAAAAVARYCIVPHIDHPVLLSGDGIDGHFANVVRSRQVFYSSRKLFLVGGVFVDLLAHRREVLLEHSLASLQLYVLVGRDSDCREYDDDRHNHHQLEQSEARGIADFRFPVGAGTPPCRSVFQSNVCRQGCLRSQESRNPHLKVASHYQSLYFVPLSACPSLLLKTSKTSSEPDRKSTRLN